MFDCQPFCIDVSTTHITIAFLQEVTKLRQDLERVNPGAGGAAPKAATYTGKEADPVTQGPSREVAYQPHTNPSRCRPGLFSPLANVTPC